MPDDIGIDPRFAVGQPVLRTEDPRLLTGGGRYTDDISMPGQIFRRPTSRTAYQEDHTSSGWRRRRRGLHRDLGDGVSGRPISCRSRAATEPPRRRTIRRRHRPRWSSAIRWLGCRERRPAKDAAELIEVDRELPALPTSRAPTRAAPCTTTFRTISASTLRGRGMTAHARQAAHVTGCADNNRLAAAR
jgi:CO/xanthine dehydrogenase Mo-binding subunit